jgi:hypothetical protein
MANNTTQIPQSLWQCETFEQQKAWCRKKFEEGHTLSDPGIWNGGGDPDRIVRALRKEGLKLETCRVPRRDAAGQIHPKTLAWRLPVSCAATATPATVEA